MLNPINLILSIIEQPTAKKPYEDFAKYLKSVDRLEEASAMLLLAERRAKHESDSSSSG